MKCNFACCVATTRLRPIRSTSPVGLGCRTPNRKSSRGEQQPNGTLVFDFSLKVKEGKDPKHLSFAGRFASGPVDDRFLYLSWWAIERGHYINRVKARLATVD